MMMMMMSMMVMMLVMMMMMMMVMMLLMMMMLLGRAGRHRVRAVHAGALLRRGRGGGAAMRRGHVLGRDRPGERGAVHRDRPRLLRDDGQHRADAVQPRHVLRRAQAGDVHAVRGGLVPGRAGRHRVRALHAG